MSGRGTGSVRVVIFRPVENSNTGVRKREHITPVLQSLHWLLVKFRIDFKILLFVYKALSGLAPQYISDLIVPPLLLEFLGLPINGF